MTYRESAAFHRTFQQLSDQLQAALGHRLFTVSYIIPDGTEAERIFTTNAEAYPVQGRKPRDRSAWTDAMARGEIFVASQPEQFGEHFFDLSFIVSLGLGAIVNVPVFDGARQMGGLNILDAAGAYTGNVNDACRAAQGLALKGFREYEAFLKQPSP